jgi:heme oxygenase
VRHFGENRLEGALHFYTGYGDKTLKEWQAFKGALQHWHVKEQDCDQALLAADEVVNSANDTFAALHAWLDKNHCKIPSAEIVLQQN